MSPRLFAESTMIAMRLEAEESHFNVMDYAHALMDTLEVLAIEVLTKAQSE
jgi:hypothetical protein